MGHDYEAGAGRVTFAPGETSGTIRVVVLDDLLPEGPEAFTATLSGARNAVIEVASATGTITDDDEAVTQAWLSRFGRTVASQVVEGIGGRLESAAIVQGREPDHQLIREGPRLAAEVPDVAHPDPGFLVDFPVYSLLQALAGIHEPREDGIGAVRVTPGATK